MRCLYFRAVELPLRCTPREGTQGRIVGQNVLPLKEEIAEVVQFTPMKRGPGRIAKQMADIPMPACQCLSFLKETVDPFERVQQRTVERVPVPQFL